MTQIREIIKFPVKVASIEQGTSDDRKILISSVSRTKYPPLKRVIEGSNTFYEIDIQQVEEDIKSGEFPIDYKNPLEYIILPFVKDYIQGNQENSTLRDFKDSIEKFLYIPESSDSEVHSTGCNSLLVQYNE